jgi:Skp family chaperone for outer membrane proteins
MKIIGLVIVVGALLASCGSNKESGVSSNDIKIAYYVKDSVAENFDYFTTTQESIQKMEEELQGKANALQQEYSRYANEYQTKMAQGLLSKNGEAFYQQKIKAIELELTSLEQTEGAELAKKAEKFQTELLEKLDKYGKEYANEHKINLFLAKEKMGSILYADSTMDVTMDFIKFLNDKVKAEKK